MTRYCAVEKMDPQWSTTLDLSSKLGWAKIEEDIQRPICGLQTCLCRQEHAYIHVHTNIYIIPPNTRLPVGGGRFVGYVQVPSASLSSNIVHDSELLGEMSASTA